MKSIIALLALATVPLAAGAGFSVYLVPSTEGGTTLAVREDLRIDVNGKALPLRIKEARQSIEYPCVAGGTLSFFRITRQGEQEQREVVASASVPAGVEKGVIVLVPHADKLTVTALWWSSAELPKGSGVFVNLVGRELGVACGGKRVRLLAGKRWNAAPANRDEGELTPLRVEIFDRDGESYTRILDQSVAIPKTDTGIYLIVPKQGEYASIVALEANGARDPVEQEALRKRLAGS